MGGRIQRPIAGELKRDRCRDSSAVEREATRAQLARIPARAQAAPSQVARSGESIELFDETDDEEGTVRNIVNRVVGAARVPRLPTWTVSRPDLEEVFAQHSPKVANPFARSGENGPTIESAMKFRGVRQSRLFGAIRAGATDVEATDRRGRTALHYAVCEAEIEIIVLLLEGGADINAADEKGATPLHLAIESSDVTRLLSSNGADVMAEDGEGKTPIDTAAVQELETKDLLVLWSDIERGRKTANQALQAGLSGEASTRARDVANALAADADDLALADAKGRTALHFAAREADLELVEFLLEAGAHPKQLDKEANTPADSARMIGKIGSQEVIQLLVEWEKKS